jgi:hypothetical protein
MNADCRLSPAGVADFNAAQRSLERKLTLSTGKFNVVPLVLDRSSGFVSNVA